MNFTGSPEYDINTTEGDIGVTKSTTHLLATAQKHLDNNELKQFQICIEPFQELPQLVDTKLQDFVTQLAENYTEPNPDIARALYTLVTVRGGKIIARLMPNHVSRLIPIMNLITQQKSRGKRNSLCCCGCPLCHEPPSLCIQSLRPFPKTCMIWHGEASTRPENHVTQRPGSSECF